MSIHTHQHNYLSVYWLPWRRVNILEITRLTLTKVNTTPPRFPFNRRERLRVACRHLLNNAIGKTKAQKKGTQHEETLYSFPLWDHILSFSLHFALKFYFLGRFVGVQSDRLRFFDFFYLVLKGFLNIIKDHPRIDMLLAKFIHIPSLLQNTISEYF